MAMDESDGVLGVAAIRQSPPTLQHQILTHGCLGNYNIHFLLSIFHSKARTGESSFDIMQ